MKIRLIVTLMTEALRVGIAHISFTPFLKSITILYLLLRQAVLVYEWKNMYKLSKRYLCKIKEDVPNRHIQYCTLYYFIFDYRQSLIHHGPFWTYFLRKLD